MEHIAVDNIFSDDWLTLSPAAITIWINTNFQNYIIKYVPAKFTKY